MLSVSNETMGKPLYNNEQCIDQNPYNKQTQEEEWKSVNRGNTIILLFHVMSKEQKLLTFSQMWFIVMGNEP